MSGDKKAKKEGESSAWKDVGWFALKTTVISGAVLGGTALVLPAIGFAGDGVVAGSLAANFQSAYLGGTIASGSAFALLQSAGAAGLATSTQAAVVAASAAFAGAHSAVTKKFRKNNETDSENTSEEPSGNDEDEEAAGFQSAYLGGTIASGSAFPLLQSAGAAVLATSTQAAVVAASAAFAGAHSAVTC